MQYPIYFKRATDLRQDIFVQGKKQSSSHNFFSFYFNFFIHQVILLPK
jgi:hypothetical protein